MLGKEGFEQTKQSKAAKSAAAAGGGAASPSSSPSSSSSSTTATNTVAGTTEASATEKQSLNNRQPLSTGTSSSSAFPPNFDDTDYTISSLTISRELGFIIGIAVPEADGSSSSRGSAAGRRPLKRNSSSASSSSSSGANGTSGGGCYLFTYNLKGNLIKCVEIAGGGNKDGSVILQTSRDGEYILLTEGGTTIKILRAFDLTPLYSFNTADAPSGGGSLAGGTAAQGLQPVDRIRSLQLVDLKYLLVGLENGRFLVYNIDFNRWNHEYSNRY